MLAKLMFCARSAFELKNGLLKKENHPPPHIILFSRLRVCVENSRVVQRFLVFTNSSIIFPRDKIDRRKTLCTKRFDYFRRVNADRIYGFIL